MAYVERMNDLRQANQKAEAVEFGACEDLEGILIKIKTKVNILQLLTIFLFDDCDVVTIL